MIITDSGGIQEDAPALAKPVLVTRYETEWPKAVQAGTAKLVGTSVERIVSAATLLLDDDSAYSQMAARRNPIGDRIAAAKIVDSSLTRHWAEHTA